MCITSAVWLMEGGIQGEDERRQVEKECLCARVVQHYAAEEGPEGEGEE